MKMSAPSSPLGFGTTAPTSVSSTNNTNSTSSTPTPINISGSAVINNASGDSTNQQFCLRWNNFRSNLQQTFLSLFEKQSFVDVTISCDEKSIKAHRLVLSACSPYFQSILKDSDCAHPVIILQGVKWTELKAVVDFMYKGEINVSQDELAGLLRVAESLKVRGLTEVCEGEDGEATISSSPPPSRPRNEEDAPRKRRRYSGDDALLNNNNNRSRSTSPDFSPPMAMDFLDTTLDPILSQANLNRSSANSSQSSSHGNGSQQHSRANINSPTASASLASSLSNLAAHLPSAMPPPGHSLGHIPPHLAHLPPLSPLSPLLNMHHPMAAARHHQTPEDFEIRPGIAEMIREEERVSTDLCSCVSLCTSCFAILRFVL